MKIMLSEFYEASKSEFSNTKTRLFKYIENFITKKQKQKKKKKTESFQIITLIFFIFLLKT